MIDGSVLTTGQTTNETPNQTVDTIAVSTAEHEGGRKKPTLALIRKIVGTHYGFDSPVLLATEACMAAVCALLLKDAYGCIALILEGPPSSGKTTALTFFKGKELREKGITFSTDGFTPASFLTHVANVKSDSLEALDLLPRIKHRAMIVADLAPTLSTREDKLAASLGILTRVLDGEGYESDSGTHGHRAHIGDFRFTLLAATTPLSRIAWKVLGRLGNRLVILETDTRETLSEDDLIDAARGQRAGRDVVDACARAVSVVLRTLWQDTGGYRGIQWDYSKDEKELLLVLARVADWAVRLRGNINVTYDPGESIEHDLPQIEHPYRLIISLANLARGHAIARGSRTLERDDVQLAVRIALDSVPSDRRRVVRELLRAGGCLTSAQVEAALGSSRTTALRTKEALEGLKAVGSTSKDGKPAIELLEAQRWLVDPANRWVLDKVL